MPQRSDESPDQTSFPGRDPWVSTPIDPHTPHSARIWNYWLGGKDHFEADRQSGDEYAEAYPQIVDVARHSRAFLGRAVRYLAESEGVRQFLDIGTGLPTVDNTHEAAQRVNPECRIVYVDNDPLVLIHARALLASSPGGACAYIDADVRQPQTILEAAADTLNFGEPIALMLLGILGHVEGDAEAKAIVRQLVSALPHGSFLVLNDGTDTSAARVTATDQHNDKGAAAYHLRSPEQIAGFFAGLELLPPGVVTTSRWRPDVGPWGESKAVDAFCGIGRKV